MFSEGKVAKMCKLFEFSDVFVKAFSLFKTSEFSLHIFYGVGIGEGSVEVCFKELPVMLISI